MPLGTFHGLRFGLILHPQFAPEIYLEGATTRQDTLSRDHHGPRAILNALERLAGSYAGPCASAQQELAIAQSQLRDYQSRLGAPFPHESYLSRLTDLRDQLKAGLSGTATADQGDEPAKVSDIAEQIKALKSEHTIEATPQRTAQRRASAEEPVTSRIRRRTETMSAPVPAVAPETSESHFETAKSGGAEALAIPSLVTSGGNPRPQSPVTKLSHFSVCVPRQTALFLAGKQPAGGFMARRKLAPGETPDAEPSQPVAGEPPEPGNSGQNRQWVGNLPEPHGRHGIDLGDGRRIVLSLSRRWNQNMIQFLATKEGVDPRPTQDDTEFLKGHGWTWRPAEKGWTRQLDKNSEEDRFARSKSDREAEDQFVTLANAIRGRNGLEPTAYSFSKEAIR
jgi:hypothetical protein